jgi:WD40 repeat protein
MIFPRSPGSGNALAAALAAVAFSGCAGPAYIPADVVLEEAHLKGQVLAFDGRATLLASGGTDGMIRLWRLPGGEALGDFRAHAGSIYGLMLVEDGAALLSAGYDGRLARWHREGHLRQERIAPSPITDMAGDESADLIVTGHEDGTVRRWRLSDLTLLSEERLHKGTVLAVAYHAPSGRIASSGDDGGVFVGRAGEPPRALPAPPGAAADLAFAPDGRHLTGSGWFRIFQWDLAAGSLRVLPTAHFGLIRSIDYLEGGRMLASISRHTDSAVHLLDPHTGALRRRLEPHEMCGGFVRVSPDGRFLASTSDDQSVRIWLLKPQMNADEHR